MSRKSKSKFFKPNNKETVITEDAQENNCVVCFKGVDTYSIGQCDHPVCFECSTRMRVLCKQNECPICRQEMPMVYFTKTIKPFKQLISANVLVDKKYKIEFENEDIRNAYTKLLEHSCPKCTDKTFSAFRQLQDHVRRVHQFNYCDLCVENLKIFTFERRLYTRHELVSHRRAGDADDKSHKGHPICEFCDIRYMDSDELFRHLRRDHLYCHFCDADGYHRYYNSYSGLRDHFSQEHYLCEEGECTDEQFTSVFRTEIDLKAHKTTAHGRMMGKLGLKQARTLELEFTLAPRQRSRRNNHNREEEEVGTILLEEAEPVYQHQSGINTDCIAEFPCLGGNSSAQSNAQSSSNSNTSSGRLMMGGKQPFRNRHNFKVNDENFPVLGNPTPPSVNVTVSNMAAQKANKTAAGVSIQVRSSKQSQPRKNEFPSLSQSSHFPALSQESNFPSLSSNASTSSAHNPQWSESKPKSKPVAQPQPKPPPKPTFNMDTAQFPSLSSGEPPSTSSKKSKKKNKSSQPQPQPPQQVTPQKSAKPEISETKPTKSEKSKKKQKDPDKSDKIDNKNKSNNKTDNNKPNNKKQDSKKTEPKEEKSKKDDIPNENVNGETNNNVVVNGDGVNLITDGLVKLAPPGFGPTPPPGFGRVKPPPGLPPPGFTHPHLYLMPRNFALRNKKLITEVVTAVGEDYFEHFKKASGMFRNDVISAQDYVEHCSAMMGHVAFDSLFPELLALLPDINKQQELWNAMDSSTKRSLGKCETCSQVLTKGDLPDHLHQHAANLDNQNFPPLPSLLPLS